jgi:hypothetical protein
LARGKFAHNARERPSGKSGGPASETLTITQKQMAGTN